MAQVKNPLQSADARGKFGENLIFTHKGGESVAKPPHPQRDARTRRQLRARTRLETVSRLFTTGYDDFETYFPAVNVSRFLEYRLNLDAYIAANAVPQKTRANGFRSGIASRQNLLIKQTLARDIMPNWNFTADDGVVQDRAAGGGAPETQKRIYNRGAGTLYVVPFAADGGVRAGVSISVTSGSQTTVDEETIGCIFATSNYYDNEIENDTSIWNWRFNFSEGTPIVVFKVSSVADAVKYIAE